MEYDIRSRGKTMLYQPDVQVRRDWNIGTDTGGVIRYGAYGYTE